MEKEQFLLILTKYLEGNASLQEENFLYAYYNIFLADTDVISLLQDKEKERLKLTIKSNINEYLDQSAKPIRKIIPWTRIAAAASIILVLSTGGYFILHKEQPRQTAQNVKQDLLPGSNKATLTLANGQKIILNKNLRGQLAQQGNMNVRIAAGTVKYTAATNEQTTANALVYNTLTTKKGEQFPLVLADGTKIWLNAASSITYPVAFKGNERKVTITGEAYFEVVHNASHPFSVNVNGQTIEDLGTHFNINAYDDEPIIRTTLLEGSVKVTKGTATVILTPGQQAQVIQGGNKIKIISQADLQEAVAWKNGLFQFNESSIPEVMRQAARWYDVDIQYEGKLPTRHFTGNLSRYTNASKLLDILSYTGVHFKIESKKIIVTP